MYGIMKSLFQDFVKRNIVFVFSLSIYISFKNIIRMNISQVGIFEWVYLSEYYWEPRFLLVTLGDMCLKNRKF